MSWRSIALSAAGALILAGCAVPRTLPWGEFGEVLKISYYRVNTDPRTKKLDPTYRVVMSNSWRDVKGESPGEPIGRAAPGRVYRGFVGDARMRSYFEELVRLGIGRLQPVEPESINPHELHRLATNPAEHEYTRVITIGTDRWHKSFTFRDQQRTGDIGLVETFVRCERRVAMMVQESILVQVEVIGPPFPRQR